MRRRHFLQLAGSAAAGALAAHASRVSVAPAASFEVRNTVNATVLVANTIAYLETDRRLGVSGWMSPDGDMIHVMLEGRPEAPWSYPEIEFSRLQPGRRYRLRMMNATASAVSAYLPGQQVEIARYSVVEADLIIRAKTLI